MKKKMTRVGNSYGIVLLPVLLELMGANLEKLKNTYLTIDYDSNTKTILISNPEIVEK